MANGEQNATLSVLGTFLYPNAEAYVATEGDPLYQSWGSRQTTQGRWFLNEHLVLLPHDGAIPAGAFSES